MNRLHVLACATLATALAALSGCGSSSTGQNQTPAVIKVDGSSTVFPIAEAVAEEYQRGTRAKVRVTVGLSGTGGGFKKLCRGDIDVANASRPILADEMAKCRAAGIQFIELPVAFDAITVVVNPRNDWLQSITVDDLKKMWEPASQAKILRWNQVRPEWPDVPLMLFGPGADSGTFDYFTEAVNHKAKASRGDFTASEDDNVLVQGVENNKNALGYFGFAYYISHKDKMRALPVLQADGSAVGPSIQTVTDGTYQPLSRPLFIYVNAASAKRAEVREFIEFYLTKGPALTAEVGFVPIPDSANQLSLKHFNEARLGSVFGGIPEVGVTIEELMRREAKL